MSLRAGLRHLPGLCAVACLCGIGLGIGLGAAFAAADAAPPAGAAEPKVLRYAIRIAETGFDPAQISDFYSATMVANYDLLVGETR